MATELTPRQQNETTQGQKVPGNTKTGTKARNYLLTLNEKTLEHYDEIKQYITHYKSLDYYLCCEHIGQENKHYHIFIQFKCAIKLNYKNLYGTHVDKSFGSPQQNYNYCMCLDEKHKRLGITSIVIDEIGELRKTGTTIQDVKAMTPEQREELPVQYLKQVREITQKEQDEKTFFDMLTEIENDCIKAPEIIYITGPSGKGKTYTAYKKALEKYPKTKIGRLTINNNFITVENDYADCYVIEEFRPNQIRASYFLQLIDKYGYQCNVKGGFKLIRPKMIIICCIYPPEIIYKDEEINSQFLRRITERIDLSDPYEELKDINL